ncbi:MAG TPA: hypothetical protein VGH27_04210 [Streptosporangiaceae bacterium]|jgi:hypothetical protein
MFRYRARTAAVLTAAAATTLTLTAAPASAATTTNPGRVASGWLARQMTNRNHFTVTYDGVTYPDQGLTIDAIFAFASTKTADNYASRALTWLARPYIMSNYIGNGTTSAYAGATANLMLAVEVRGGNPASFGGVNLETRLAGLLTASGRYSDVSKYGDNSNALSQSLAIIGTSRLGGAPASAVSFLAGSECANGGFPIYFAQSTCVSDPDATGMAVQALLAAGDSAAADRGLNWLGRVQQANGGFATTPKGNPNTNSTGLAGEALAAGNWSAQAAVAKSWLLSMQVGCTGKAFAQGALAYNKFGFRKGTAALATAQGILGLAGVPLYTLSAQGSAAGDPELSC